MAPLHTGYEESCLSNASNMQAILIQALHGHIDSAQAHGALLHTLDAASCHSRQRMSPFSSSTWGRFTGSLMPACATSRMRFSGARVWARP